MYIKKKTFIFLMLFFPLFIFCSQKQTVKSWKNPRTMKPFLEDLYKNITRQYALLDNAHLSDADSIRSALNFKITKDFLLLADENPEVLALIHGIIKKHSE